MEKLKEAKEAFKEKEQLVSQPSKENVQKCAKKKCVCFQQSHKCHSDCDNVIVSNFTDISRSHYKVAYGEMSMRDFLLRA